MATASINLSPLEQQSLQADQLVTAPIFPMTVFVNGIKCTINRAVDTAHAESPKPSETHQSKVDIELPNNETDAANAQHPRVVETVMKSLEDRMQSLAVKGKPLIENVTPFLIIILVLLFVGMVGFIRVNNQLNAQSKHIAQLNCELRQHMTGLQNTILALKTNEPIHDSSTRDASSDAQQLNPFKTLNNLLLFITEEMEGFKHTLYYGNNPDEMKRRTDLSTSKQRILKRLLEQSTGVNVVSTNIDWHDERTITAAKELRLDVLNLGLHCHIKVDENAHNVRIYVATSPAALRGF